MSGRSMDVSSLRDTVVGEYRKFATSFTTIHAEDVLEIYDAMTAAARTGKPYETRLDPPPADPRVAHPESTRPAWAKKGAR